MEENNELVELNSNTDIFDIPDSKELKNRIHSVSLIVAVIFLIYLFGLYGFVYLIDGILPKPLSVIDEKDYPDAFITERARSHLEYLTNIGPRITGTPENEEKAVKFLIREIDIIQELASPSRKIEKDLQIVSGSYYIDYKPDGAISSYAEVQNVIVKLYSTNYSEHSVLVNAHFDSVATSPGGSDDGINCAVMLEIFRKLAQSDTPLMHNIIFLFNGAEETPLQASHGFITQHKWAKEVRVVVNLEASGAGGKEILFQSGPQQPWLLDYYSKVPRPNGQAAGEEIFQSGIIPSDTDFRIFRDFGKIVGLDFAFNRNGYRYHTKFDGYLNIPSGSFQHVGDNMLTLIRSLANASELFHVETMSKQKVVFYDVFGCFMVYYSETTAIVVNVIVCVLSLGIALNSFRNFGLGFTRSSTTYIALTFIGILLGWIVAALVAISLALIIDALGQNLSWYNSSWIIFGLYCLPVIICSYGSIVLSNQFNSKNDLNIGIHAQIQAHVIRIIWTIPLLIGTIIRLRSVYIILIPIFFQVFVFSIIRILNLQRSVRNWKIVYIMGTIIPTLFLMKQALEIMAVLIPICGRIGSSIPSELIISILTFMLTILIASYYSPFVTLIHKSFLLFLILFGIFALFFVFIFTPLGFPYSNNPSSPTPQRFWIYHLNRVVHTENNTIQRDSGFFLLNMDRNSPGSIKNYVNLSSMQYVIEDCNNILFCGFPMASMRMVPALRDSVWIPANETQLPEVTNLELISKIQLNTFDAIFNFTATGPNHISIYISARPNVVLTEIDLIPQLPSKTTIWNGRPAYVIMRSCGKTNIPLNFSVKIHSNKNFSGPSFDIAVAGKYMYDKVNNKTFEYIHFLNQFPDWADIYAWLGSYESWIY